MGNVHEKRYTQSSARSVNGFGGSDAHLMEELFGLHNDSIQDFINPLLAASLSWSESKNLWQT